MGNINKKDIINEDVAKEGNGNNIILKSDKLILKIIDYNSADYEEELKLRDEVLRKPLQMSIYNEDLSGDKTDIHLGVYIGNDLVGCLLLKELDNQTFKMRQVAVKPEYRGKGIGRKMVEYTENYAIENGYSKINLHARKNAIGFYEKLGYRIIGDEFLELRIPHHKMEKNLK
ncbi:MAG: GNAT family N-acetyltransferase [bacterium]